MSALDDEIRPGSRTAGGLVGLDNGRYGGAAGARADAAVRSAWAGPPSRVGGALVYVAAIAVAIQSALNGRVGAAAGSPWPATLVNFAVAALTLAVTLLVELTVRGVPSGQLTGAPWLYSAGLIGIVVTLTAVMLTARPPR